MPLDVGIRRFTRQKLQPLYNPSEAIELQVNLPPSVTLAKGTVLGNVGTAAVNAVQTWTISGSPGSGSFIATIPIGGSTTLVLPALAYNVAGTGTGSLNEKLQALLGASNVAATGSAGGPYTVTYSGEYAGQPIPAPTFTNTFNTGSIASATATAGQTGGTYNTYNSAAVASPTAPPVLSGAGTDGTLSTGTHEVAYTYKNAQGETSRSPMAFITLTSTQHIAVASITGIPAGITSVNVYLDGNFVQNQAVTSNATGGFNILAPGTGGSPPAADTAFSGAVGTAKCILSYDCITDANGYIQLGALFGGANLAVPMVSVPAYFPNGETYFKTSDLVGLDAKALSDMGGTVISGTVTSGIIRI